MWRILIYGTHLGAAGLVVETREDLASNLPSGLKLMSVPGFDLRLYLAADQQRAV